MRAAVTGAAGFIGRQLSMLLRSKGIGTLGLDLRPVPDICDEWSAVNITQRISPESLADVKVIYHLAGKVHALAEVKQDEEEYFRINTEGTRNVLEAAKKAGVRRFVFFSTVKAMSRDGAGAQGAERKEQSGRNLERREESLKDELSTSNIQHPTLNSQHQKKPVAGVRPAEAGDRRSDVATLRTFNEEDFIEPDTPYGKSKLEAEKLVLYGGYVPEPVVLRLCMVYGPGAKGNMQKMLQAIAKHRFPPLPEVNNKRSMVHVQDVVKAAILAAEGPEAVGQTFIVSDGHSYSTRQIYDLMCQALGRRPPKWSIPIPCLRALGLAGDAIGKLRGKRFMFDSDALEKLIGSAWFSSQKIETKLGFKPEWNLEKALPEMVAEMQSAERQAQSVKREGEGAEC